jgi:hypothetical protein
MFSYEGHCGRSAESPEKIPDADREIAALRPQ